MKNTRAFTLIELLIVVAIIAILAAIAIPNFLEAQTRAKVARVASDLRTIATGIESYRVDNNRTPPAANFQGNSLRVFWAGTNINGVPVGSITTPIAYLTSVPADPFETFVSSGVNTRPGTLPFGYEKAGFGLEGTGPFPDGPFQVKGSGGFVVQVPSDYKENGINANGPVNGFVRDEWETPTPYALWSIGPSGDLPPRRSGDSATSRYIVDGRYDPTNGTVSVGYLIRYGSQVSFP